MRGPILATLRVGWYIAFSVCFGSLSGVIARSASASHTVFDFRVDRFEVSGNVPGLAADDFADGTVSPWTVDSGTVTETGGALRLSNPGTHSQTFADLNPSVTLDVSAAIAPGPFWVADGAGDFTATSKWLRGPGGSYLPQPPGDFYTMMLAYPLDPPIASKLEVILVAFRNFDPSHVVYPTTGSSGPNFAIARFRQTVATGQIYEYYPATIPVSESSLTGDIVLTLDYNDTLNEVTASFSTDGGASFTFFSPIPSSLTAAGGNFALVADPFDVVSVPALAFPYRTLLAAGLLALASLIVRKRPARLCQRE